MSNKVIRKHSAARVSKYDLADLGGRPKAPVADAAQAPGPVVDAAALQRAREQGYQEGFAAARQQGGAEADAQRADLKALVDGINELMRDFEQGLANDVLSMSLELSKLIVRSSLRVKPDLVISVVREAVATLPGISDQTVLHVNPADAVLLRKLAASDAQLKELPWRIVEDPQLERGGCRLATPATEVDASLETRWRRVIASLGRDDAWIDITI